MQQRTLDIDHILDAVARMTHAERLEDKTALGQISVEEDPFRVLIATILSARTKDETTLAASDRLFAKYPNVQSLARAKADSVRKMIKPVGFYKTKAPRIIQVAKLLIKMHNGKVPESLEELLELPGVGRKTANCVLVYGFRKPAIPVDTHVHRISNRLGLCETKTPEETEIELMRKVDSKFWLDINELFVRFGQEVCRPIGPKCDICLLNKVCKYAKEIAKLRD
ncbi:MAG: endonuclease III [Thaumarchaeota archaeon]|nr:endonuclease III [Nitrososphaerota archaeon]